MTKLTELYESGGQSPWLDNLRRDWLHDGELENWIRRGVRGLTSNPSIFQQAITGSDLYDTQFGELIAGGATITDAFWELVITDIEGALALLRPIYDQSGGTDGFASVEVDPGLARDTDGTVEAARQLHHRIAQPNLYVKIPGTAEGVPAIQQVLSEGHSVNVTLLFGIARYDDVIEAYLTALEAADGDLSAISSVASFFVSRVDAAVDARLDQIDTAAAKALKGKVAVANAQLAYELFLERFSGERWDALAARGARVQRPLWASTSTKDPTYPATLYVDTLIAPDTVNTMPNPTLEAFEVGGTVRRTADSDLAGAHRVLDELATVGIDLDQVTAQLEVEGVAAFEKSFDDLTAALATKADLIQRST